MSDDSYYVSVTALNLAADLRARTNALRRACAEHAVAGAMSDVQEVALLLTSAKREAKRSSTVNTATAAALREELNELARRFDDAAALQDGPAAQPSALALPDAPAQ